MIGQDDIRDKEFFYCQLVAVQDKIQLTFWGVTGVRGETLVIGILETGRSKKEIKLLSTPEDIEISGNDDRALRFFYQLVELMKLTLSVVIGQRKVDKKNGQICCPGLNDKSFDTLSEKMKLMSKDFFLTQEGISLLGKKRESSGKGAGMVFRFNNMIISQATGQGIGLATISRPKRTRIHLHQPDDIRRQPGDEFGDLTIVLY